MAIIIDPDAPAGPVTDPGPFLTEADRLYARLEPVAYADEANGYPLRELAAALTGPREIIEDVVRDRDTGEMGWSPAFDPDLVPDELLDWLAQLPGVIFPASALTADEKRDRIAQAAGFWRGTRQAVIDEAARTLTGTKTVRLFERVNGNPYRLLLATDPSETPDSAATLRAAQSQIPGGHKLEHVVSAEPLIEEITRQIDNINVTIDSMTIADVT